MCGIIGYCGAREAQKIISDGLKKLEYRGYDSAGLAVVSGDKIKLYKKKGTVNELIRSTPTISGKLAIGHTRWATHGEPSDSNAHPFLSCDGSIALAHNGIIENYLLLREKLLKKGHKFSSETDSEVLVHLIENYYDGNLEKAVRKALAEVKGSYAIAVIHSKEEKLVCARLESPLVVGIGDKEYFIGSDVPAFLQHTRKAVYLEDGELAVLDSVSQRLTVKNLNNKILKKEVQNISWSIDEVEKRGYDHFMLKEIHEQPKSIRETIRGRISEQASEVILDELSDRQLEKINEVKLLGCGTSYNAALIGSWLISTLAKIKASAELASEFRYSNAILDKDALVLGITQSGETADTLAAVRKAKEQGYKTLALVNVLGSSITRVADSSLYIRCGPEICVAATKSFLAQLVMLTLLAVKLGTIKKTINLEDAKTILVAVKRLPRDIQKILDDAKSIIELAKDLSNAQLVFFIGRNVNYATALEGALKLKEIAYIPAEGYAAGELKHGPFALLTKDVLVAAIAVKDQTYDLMLSTIGEVKARGAKVVAIGEEDDTELEKYADAVLSIPKGHVLLSPIPISVIYQLLAYYTAKRRGCEIDKPRNLAKSVTVP
ncbi:MAG: glutamine--fructose-6-phosphate transaminase (isomerizing) [Candidatus Thermoplasmatota archaeon]|nr:glutamine--fructose-6-phosphate transaminase (isomerizing) [Candidatus Thermoplasmatota archaeon]